MRSIRKQPFAWQEKHILRKLRKQYSGATLVKLRCLYGALTEIDSDFNGEDVKYYTKTIATYSGLHRDWIPGGLSILQKMEIIKIVEQSTPGRFTGKTLTFLGGFADNTVAGKTVDGNSGNGETGTLEHSNSIEHKTVKKKDRLKSQIEKMFLWQTGDVVVAWESFLFFRAKKGQPMTPRAEKMGLSKVNSLCNGDPELAVKIIDQSTFKGWTDFYELKNGNNGQQSHENRKTRVENAIENFGE